MNPNYGGQGVLDWAKRGLQIAKAALSLVPFRDKAPPNVRRWLQDHGNEPITALEVCRLPLAGGISLALNALTLGQWDKAKRDLGYDKLFHLYLVVHCARGEVARLERNHDVEMAKYHGAKGAECRAVKLHGPLTLDTLLTKTINKVGPNLWRYDPAEATCQVFCKDVLQANGLLTGPLQDFIMQDAKALLSKINPAVAGMMQKVTDLAHKGSVLLTGRGARRPRRRPARMR